MRRPARMLSCRTQNHCVQHPPTLQAAETAAAKPSCSCRRQHCSSAAGHHGGGRHDHLLLVCVVGHAVRGAVGAQGSQGVGCSTAGNSHHRVQGVVALHGQHGAVELQINRAGCNMLGELARVHAMCEVDTKYRNALPVQLELPRTGQHKTGNMLPKTPAPRFVVQSWCVLSSEATSSHKAAKTKTRICSCSPATATPSGAMHSPSQSMGSPWGTRRPAPAPGCRCWGTP